MKTFLNCKTALTNQPLLLCWIKHISNKNYNL